MAMMHPLPGFYFDPTDEEIIVHYLGRKMKGEPLPTDSVVECDIYGDEEPWKIFGMSSGQKFFVFTTLKKKSKSRIDRSVGCGTWKAQCTEKIHDRDDKLIGFKKLFIYEEKKTKSVGIGHWIMHEFSLRDYTKVEQFDHEHVFCRIRNKDMDKIKRPVRRFQHHAYPSNPQVQVVETNEINQGNDVQMLNPNPGEENLQTQEYIQRTDIIAPEQSDGLCVAVVPISSSTMLPQFEGVYGSNMYQTSSSEPANLETSLFASLDKEMEDFYLSLPRWEEVNHGNDTQILNANPGEENLQMQECIQSTDIIAPEQFDGLCVVAVPISSSTMLPQFEGVYGSNMYQTSLFEPANLETSLFGSLGKENLPHLEEVNQGDYTQMLNANPGEENQQMQEYIQRTDIIAPAQSDFTAHEQSNGLYVAAVPISSSTMLPQFEGVHGSNMYQTSSFEPVVLETSLFGSLGKEILSLPHLEEVNQGNDTQMLNANPGEENLQIKEYIQHTDIIAPAQSDFTATEQFDALCVAAVPISSSTMLPQFEGVYGSNIYQTSSFEPVVLETSLFGSLGKEILSLPHLEEVNQGNDTQMLNANPGEENLQIQEYIQHTDIIAPAQSDFTAPEQFDAFCVAVMPISSSTMVPQFERVYGSNVYQTSSSEPADLETGLFDSWGNEVEDFHMNLPHMDSRFEIEGREDFNELIDQYFDHPPTA